MTEDNEAERRHRVASVFSADSRDPNRSLCAAAASLVGVSGAGVVLMSGGRALGNVCVSDAVAEAIEDVQFTLGEGPCVDAWRSKAPVLVPDLAADDLVRWPEFRIAAQAKGMRAAFGIPLLIEAVCIGALNLYHDRPGALTGAQLDDALAAAHVAGRIVLGWQSVAGAGSLAWQLEQVPRHRAVVHQAAGIVSVQAGVPVDDALVLLRAHAFAEDHRITSVAEDVVGGRLRFGSSPT
ncbi:MAG TPA: GAF and ANTAR domain-containing protein [Acidimicrobiia bacterium]|nr:GAF and ANTAR domain-containing protein [Acidimicrobiia bacterium]